MTTTEASVDDQYPLGMKQFSCSLCGYTAWESQETLPHNQQICNIMQGMKCGKPCPHPGKYIKKNSYGRKYCTICDQFETGKWTGDWK